MIMEKNIEKELRTYIQPETEVITLVSEKILAGFESGADGGEIG